MGDDTRDQHLARCRLLQRRGGHHDETIEFVTGIDWLSPDDRDKIFAGNLLRLYNRIDASRVGRQEVGS